MGAEHHIPLKPEVFQILLRLLRGDSHGYQIMRDVADSTDGEVKMLAGALYRHLGRMLDDGMIVELESRGDGDDRRRHYGITPFGREVAEAEAARLARLVAVARAHDLLKTSG